jgi:hypothetical protein
MKQRLVMEAVMAAIYGEIMFPIRPVEYVVPYSSIMELYELRDHVSTIMPDPADDAHVRKKILEMIAFFDNELNRKKIEKIFALPWRMSAPLVVNNDVSFVVVNVSDNEQYGESFDPIETEMLLTAVREQLPILTDQPEFVERIISFEIPIQVFDVEDLEYALETDRYDASPSN